MPPERIVTFPWGVDLDHFSPHSNALEKPLFPSQPEKPFILLSTRAWEPIYGLDVLARGFVQAAQTIPQLRLVMLGNGSLASRLRSIFSDGQVLERVVFPGQIKQNDLPRYYRNADLYISASHSDGTSISLLEAMACGCPVLVSDIPGNRAWVEPGVQGWWFKDGDPQILADGIQEAFTQSEHLPVMGSAARQLAKERANWPENFKKLLFAYDLALNNKVKPSNK
jgi:glycosyltransferase involved in cell wall biosynthesis